MKNTLFVDAASDAVITVGIFSHDQAPFVEACVNSIADQAHAKFVLVDDGSSDESPIRLRMAAQQLRATGRDVRVELGSVNRGLAYRVNSFLAKVDTEFFCLVNADDVFLNGGLEILRRAALRAPEAMVIFSDYGRIDADGKALPSPSSLARIGSVRDRFSSFPRRGFDELLAFGNFVPGGCTLVRTQAVRSANAEFDPSLVIAEDYDFWLQLGRGCHYLFVPERTWNYRILESSKFHSAGSSGLRSELRVIGRYRAHVPWILSIRSIVQGVHRAKMQWLYRSDPDRVKFSETARILDIPIWLLLFTTLVAGCQTVARKVGLQLRPRVRSQSDILRGR